MNQQQKGLVLGVQVYIFCKVAHRNLSVLNYDEQLRKIYNLIKVIVHSLTLIS